MAPVLYTVRRENDPPDTHPRAITTSAFFAVEVARALSARRPDCTFEVWNERTKQRIGSYRAGRAALDV